MDSFSNAVEDIDPEREEKERKEREKEQPAIFTLSEDYYCRLYRKYGIGCLEDKTIVFILELMKAAGYDKVCFYDREDRWSVPEFVQWVKNDDKIFSVVYKKDGTPISIAWFCGFSMTGHQSYAHFSTLKTATPEECLVSGRMLLKLIVRVTSIRQFIGITPMCYRHALSFSEGLGFKPLTVLKKYAMLRGKERDMRLSICEPEAE